MYRNYHKLGTLKPTTCSPHETRFFFYTILMMRSFLGAQLLYFCVADCSWGDIMKAISGEYLKRKPL